MRGDVLAADLRVDALRAGAQSRDVAEQEARDVEDVDAEVLDDEALVRRKIGLAARTRRSAERKGSGPRTACRLPPSSPPSPPGSADCQRKFSCTIRGTPAALQHAATIARASSSVLANGFWQMTGTRRRRPSPPADGGSPPWWRYRRSRALRREASRRIGVAAGNAELVAAVSASRSASRSQNATISAPSTSSQACIWLRAKKPQPISAPLQHRLMFSQRQLRHLHAASRAAAARCAWSTTTATMMTRPLMTICQKLN